MKKKIIEALATKFEGVSEKILSRIAEKLAKTITTDEDVESAVEAVTFQQVLESYGDSRATEASATAVTNYERKHNLKNGQKVDGGENNPQPTDDPKTNNANDEAPSWAKALIADNKALKEQIEAMKGEKVVNDRKSALGGVLKGLPDALKNRYEKDFARLAFKDDNDFNEWLGDTKNDIEALSTSFVKSAVVGKPKAGDSKKAEAVNPLVQARIDASNNQPSSSAIAGLNNTSK